MASGVRYGGANIERGNENIPEHRFTLYWGLRTANILAMQICEYQVSLYNFTEFKPYLCYNLNYNFVL